MFSRNTSSSIPTPPPLPPEKNSNTPQNSGNANSTAISGDVLGELKKKFAKQNQEVADDNTQLKEEGTPVSLKPIQRNTQSKPQQQPTTEINNSDKDKIVTTQPTLENSSMTLPRKSGEEVKPFLS